MLYYLKRKGKLFWHKSKNFVKLLVGPVDSISSFFVALSKLFVGIIITITTILVIIYACSEATHVKFTIEPFEINHEGLKQIGITGTSIANAIIDNIDKFSTDSEDRLSSEELPDSEYHTEISIPGSGIETDVLVELLRNIEFLGGEPHIKISGEIINENSEIQIILRIKNINELNIVKKIKCEIGNNCEKGKELNSLLEETANHILSEIYPSVRAGYLLKRYHRIEKETVFENCEEQIRKCIDFYCDDKKLKDYEKSKDIDNEKLINKIKCSEDVKKSNHALVLLCQLYFWKRCQLNEKDQNREFNDITKDINYYLNELDDDNKLKDYDQLIKSGIKSFIKEEFDTAKKKFEDAKKKKPENEIPGIYLAKIFEQTGDYGKVEQELLNDIDNHPNECSGYYKLGIHYYKRSKKEDVDEETKKTRLRKAKEQFNKADDKGKQCKTYQFFIDWGDVLLGLDEFREAISRYENAYNTLTTKEKQFPNRKEARERITKAYLKWGDKDKKYNIEKDKAIHNYREAIGSLLKIFDFEDKKKIPDASKKSFKSTLELANISFKNISLLLKNQYKPNDNTKEYKKDLQETTKQYTRLGFMFRHNQMYQYADKIYENAEKEYNSILGGDCFSATYIYSYWGIALKKLWKEKTGVKEKFYEAAENKYKEAIRLCPDYLFTYHYLGRLYCDKYDKKQIEKLKDEDLEDLYGLFETSLENVDKAIRKMIEDEKYNNLLHYVYHTKCLLLDRMSYIKEIQNQHSEAEDDCTEAKEACDKAKKVYTDSGNGEYYEEAEKTLEKICK